MDKKITITIFGKVQGVWFRKMVKEIADKFGFVGYAKNQDNGTVEVIACGDQSHFDDFVDQVKKGSKLSNVDNIVYDIYDKCDEIYNDFKIL